MRPARDNTRPLLLALAASLCLLLAWRFAGFLEERGRILRGIDVIEEHVRAAPEAVPAPAPGGGTGEPSPQEGEGGSDWMLNGLSFYDLRETNRFFLERIREDGSSLDLLPPKDLFAMPVGGGIKLAWSANPLNAESIKKLAGNPLLQLHYKIYRWTKDSRPQVAAVLSLDREEYLDDSVGPVRREYYYCVLLVLESIAEKNRIFIESERSNVISAVSSDRFKLEVIGGTEETAFVSVTITYKGRTYSESFRVSVGDKIGGSMEKAGVGTLDFSTGLVLKAIRPATEEREVTVKVPEFNSDGSIKIDHTTKEPVFRELTEKRPVKVISIECADPDGRIRVFKES